MKTKTIKPAILIHFDPYPIFRQPLWRQGDVVLPTHLPRLERHADVENGDDLRPKLASADVDSRVVGLQAFLENPRRTACFGWWGWYLAYLHRPFLKKQMMIHYGHK